MSTSRQTHCKGHSDNSLALKKQFRHSRVCHLKNCRVRYLKNLYKTLAYALLISAEKSFDIHVLRVFRKRLWYTYFVSIEKVLKIEMISSLFMRRGWDRIEVFRIGSCCILHGFMSVMVDAQCRVDRHINRTCR